VAQPCQAGRCERTQPQDGKEDQPGHEVGIEWRAPKGRQRERQDLASRPEHEGGATAESAEAQQDIEREGRLGDPA